MSDTAPRVIWPARSGQRREPPCRAPFAEEQEVPAVAAPDWEPLWVHPVVDDRVDVDVRGAGSSVVGDRDHRQPAAVETVDVPQVPGEWTVAGGDHGGAALGEGPQWTDERVVVDDIAVGETLIRPRGVAHFHVTGVEPVRDGQVAGEPRRYPGLALAHGEHDHVVPGLGQPAREAVDHRFDAAPRPAVRRRW